MLVKTEVTQIKSPDDVVQAVTTFFEHAADHDKHKEHCFAFGVNTMLNIVYMDLISIGTLNQSIVHPRDVFSYGITQGVHAIILAHNHPSGDTNPSKEDDAITQVLVSSGAILRIPLLDHIVLGSPTNDKYFSYSSEGAL